MPQPKPKMPRPERAPMPRSGATAGARTRATTRRRRTQEERRVAMRARLLDATVECLIAHGYAGASTPRICAAARVSRGAQLHHFPTKERLIVAAVGHLMERRHQQFRAALSAVPEGPDRGPIAVDLLWEIIASDTFYAWLELCVAARTDERLRVALHELSQSFSDRTRETFVEFFPNALGDAVLDIAPEFVFAVMEGLAVRGIYAPEDGRAGRVLLVVKMLAGAVAPQVRDGSGSKTQDLLRKLMEELQK